MGPVGAVRHLGNVLSGGVAAPALIPSQNQLEFEMAHRQRSC
jgi:hypothetical protein